MKKVKLSKVTVTSTGHSFGCVVRGKDSLSEEVTNDLNSE